MILVLRGEIPIKQAISEAMAVRSADAAAIRDLPLFRGMADDRFDALVQPAFLQRFPPHVVLFERGQTPDFLYVVLEGAIELFARHADRETTIAVLRPISTFILAAVIKRQPVLTSGRTLDPSRVLMIPTDVVLRALSDDAAFASAIACELADAYRSVVQELKSQKLRTSVERLANWIIRENTFTGGEGQFDIPFDKRTLASRLGMTPENLSRNFATLTRHGVEVHGRTIRITDKPALERLAMPDPLIDEVTTDA
ncbi:cyclic nucleotide-binding domain-containing protein [Alsobacter sp. R-9]